MEIMKPFTVKKKKKLAVVVFKPDNTHLLVFKRCVKRESYSILVNPTSGLLSMPRSDWLSYY